MALAQFDVAAYNVRRSEVQRFLDSRPAAVAELAAAAEIAARRPVSHPRLSGSNIRMPRRSRKANPVIPDLHFVLRTPPNLGGEAPRIYDVGHAGQGGRSTLTSPRLADTRRACSRIIDAA